MFSHKVWQGKEGQRGGWLDGVFVVVVLAATLAGHALWFGSRALCPWAGVVVGRPVRPSRLRVRGALVVRGAREAKRSKGL